MLTFAPLMEIIGLNEQRERLAPCVATVGFFDGVHRGHLFLIDKVKDAARQMGVASLVVTFAAHPRQVLRPDWHPQLLSTLDEKMALLEQTGVDRLAVLPFDAAMAGLSARAFMADVLSRRLGVRGLVTGYDNHFGHRVAGSTEGFDDYVRYGRELGVSVLPCSPFDADEVRVSSSQIRRFLQDGEVGLAARCLGRSYELTGKVVRGEHVGTELGFPTANLLPSCADKLTPAPGVYAVKVRVGDSREVHHGMMNIGRRPTFDGDHLTLETHIFHFNANIYDRQMTVGFVRRLRSEMKFDSREALASQLAADARLSEATLNKTIGI